MLSRAVHARTSDDDQFTDACSKSVYRWKVGSSDAPVRVATDGSACDDAATQKEMNPLIAPNGIRVNLDDGTAASGHVPFEKTSVQVVDANGAVLASRALDTAGTGMSPAYFAPIAISGDGEDVYITLFSEISYFGRQTIWTWSWKTDQFRELKATGGFDDDSDSTYISTATKEMVGVSSVRVPNENDPGSTLVAPSSVRVIDLSTGSETVVATTKTGMFEHPMLSEDGTKVLVAQDQHLTLFALDGTVLDQFVGKALVWKGDIVVVERQGILYAHNVATKLDQPLMADGASFGSAEFLIVP